MHCPPKIRELLKVLYDLSGSEAELLYYLCDSEARTTEIAEDIGKDRSTVQRYLSKLRATGLVERESRVEGGKRGRYYVYSVPDKEEMKRKIQERLDEWEDERIEELREM